MDGSSSKETSSRRSCREGDRPQSLEVASLLKLAATNLLFPHGLQLSWGCTTKPDERRGDTTEINAKKLQLRKWVKAFSIIPASMGLTSRSTMDILIIPTPVPGLFPGMHRGLSEASAYNTCFWKITN